MAIEARNLADVSEERLARRQRGRVRRMLRRMRFAGVAAGVIVLIALVALAAPLIAPFEPDDVEVRDRLQPPLTEGHLLGTDALGQDLLSRVIYGTRISLLVGVLVVAISGSIGVVLGLLSGYYGGWLDSVIMRLADIQLAFPTIILYIAVLAVLGPGLLKLVIVMGIVAWVPFGRVERGMVLSVRQQDHVLAARSMGASDRVILFRHILPNTMGPLIVVASFGVAAAIVTEASLSFLGLGVPPSVPSWAACFRTGGTTSRTVGGSRRSPESRSRSRSWRSISWETGCVTNSIRCFACSDGDPGCANDINLNYREGNG